MQRILFSTLGMTDPIKNGFDGPFLHIMRHYRPQKAYLFMTKRVCELADQDDRYRIQAKRLCAELGFDCEIFELRYADIDNPQEFDIFYPIFEKELIKAHNLHKDWQILINLSSGTPQMKSSCHMLAVTVPFPVIPVQVTTPNERENYGSPNYDVEKSWMDNVDNASGAESINRAKLVESENLRFLILREAAISNIEAYNYKAALNILTEVQEFFSADVLHLLEAGQHRINMELKEAGDESELAQYDLFPIKSGDAHRLFEYLLRLGIQQKSGQLMDYVRGISPALSLLFECFLDVKCKRLVKRDYCEPVRSDPGHYKLRRYKMERKDRSLLDYYDTKYANGFKDGSDLSCSALLPMIEYDCAPDGGRPDAAVLKKAQEMRKIEENIRNPAAHNILAIKEERFIQVAGITSERLLKDMQWLFMQIYPRYFAAGKEVWNSYDVMNAEIIRRMKAGSNPLNRL